MPETRGADWNELLVLLLVGEGDRLATSSVIFSPSGASRDIPGNCTRAEFDPWSDLSSSST